MALSRLADIPRTNAQIMAVAMKSRATSAINVTEYHCRCCRPPIDVGIVSEMVEIHPAKRPKGRVAVYKQNERVSTTFWGSMAESWSDSPEFLCLLYSTVTYGSLLLSPDC